MIGANPIKDAFKCAPIRNAGALSLDPDPGDPAQQHARLSPHQVMVCLNVSINAIASMDLPAGSLYSERVDPKTQDAFPMHVCNLVPNAAMTGIRGDRNLLLCATDPHLD
jgi:hypothetical protein